MKEIMTKLTVDAGHPAVRINVLDSNYSVQASGYGRIEKELPTGYYTLQYKAADAIQERDITLLPNQPLLINDSPDLPFSSAVPLEYTSTSHEYQQDHAHRISLAKPLERGKGSQVFIFVRDVEKGGRTHPAQGLSLHRLTGERVVHFDEVIESSRGSKEARWGGINIEVDPGVYRLRLAISKGKVIEMALPACPNWQSQAFLLRQGDDSNIGGKQMIDLLNSTQLMARPIDGFNPRNFPSTQKRVEPDWSGEDLRLMELAKQALAHGYRGLRSSDLRAMLWGKWEDPLLGILGLHLLLMQPKPDLDLAKDVVTRLKGILNNFHHPDVEALSLGIGKMRGEKTEIAPFDAPPMLRKSWDILVKATSERPELIPFDSLAYQVADRLWGSSTWLIWQTLMPEPKTRGLASTSKIPVMDKNLSIQNFKNRVVVDDVTLYKQGFSASVEDDLQMEMDFENKYFETLDGGESKTYDNKLEQHTNEITIDVQDFVTVRTAIEELLIQKDFISSRLSIEKLAQKAQLTDVEFALLSMFQGYLIAQQRSYMKNDRKAFSLDNLVVQLGIPAEVILSGMGSLYIKLKVLR